jgi:hypothetical protein
MLRVKLLFVLFVAYYAEAQQNNCQNLGTLGVFFDPACSSGGAGCNAGGQVRKIFFFQN